MMTDQQYRDALEKLGITQRGAARMMDIGERTSRKMASGDSDVPRAVELLLKLMIDKKITPEQAFEIAGIKLPKAGFTDGRGWRLGLTLPQQRRVIERKKKGRG